MLENTLCWELEYNDGLKEMPYVSKQSNNSETSKISEAG